MGVCYTYFWSKTFKLPNNGFMFVDLNYETPAAFAEQYEAAKQAGEAVVVITLSSKLSGTYQSAGSHLRITKTFISWIVALQQLAVVFW